MHTQFTIFKKGLALIAVPLLVQAVFIAVLVRAQADHVRAQDMAVHTKDVIVKVEELYRGLVEGYARIRTLVFSGDRSGAGRYEAALKRVPAQVEELRELVSDNPRQTPRVTAIGTRSGAFLDWIAGEARLVREARGTARRPASGGASNSSTTCGRPSTRSAARRRGWTGSGWSASARPLPSRPGRSSAGAWPSWSRR